MSTEEAFQKAAKEVQWLKKVPSNAEKLKLYGLYKQGTGATVENPGEGLAHMFTEAYAKYQAWKKVNELSVEDAQTQYIELVESYKEKYGFEPPVEEN